MPSVTTLVKQEAPARPTGIRVSWPPIGVRAYLLVSALVVAVVGYFIYLVAHQNLGPHHQLFDLKIYYNAMHFWSSGNDLYDYSQPDSANVRLGYTYPPLGAVAMIPMVGLSLSVVSIITVVSIVSATAWCTWLCLRQRFTIARVDLLMVVGLATAGMFMLEPLRANLSFGQVNLFLMMLVLTDILILERRGSRWTGVGVGLAAAIKLTPGIFLLYFLLGRNWKAVRTAIFAGAAATLFAGLVMPIETWRYFTSLLFDSARVGYLYGRSNQSLQGLLERLAVPGELGKPLVLLLVAGVGVLVVMRIRRAIAAGDRMAALTLTGLLGILISPASWTHHMVWIIPAMVIVATAIIRRVELTRAVPLLLFTAIVMVYDVRNIVMLPDSYFQYATLSQRLVASLPMFWVLAAALLLPIGQAVKAEPDMLARSTVTTRAVSAR